MGASRVSEPSSSTQKRMAGSIAPAVLTSTVRPSYFGPAGDNPFGKGRKPRGEDLEPREPQGGRRVTRNMVRQIRAREEGREIPAPEKRRRSEYAGQRNMRGMIRQIRESEEAMKRAN